MQERRAKISFWITVLSFTGSILFVANMILFGDHRSPECKDCVQKLLYYQHRADSLQHKIEQADNSKK